MNSLAVLVSVVVLAQGAVVPKLIPTSDLFPREQPSQDPGYFSPVKVPRTIDTRGVCRKSPQQVDNNRIVGGEEAKTHEFPWQTGIFMDGDGYFCGGSIVKDEYILTAAHCVHGYKNFKIAIGPRGLTQVTLRSTNYTVHPGWNSATMANDIALIRLPTPITFTSEIAPLCLAPATEPTHVGELRSADGWTDGGRDLLRGTGLTDVDLQ